MTSIKLFRSRFGLISLISAATDLVTHAHAVPHIILWLDGAPGRMQVGSSRSIDLGPGVAVGVNAFEPHSHSFAPDSRPGMFLVAYLDPVWAAERSGERPLFQQAAVTLDPWLESLCTGVSRQLADAVAIEEIDSYEIERLSECLLNAFGASKPRAASGKSENRPDHRVRKAAALMREKIANRFGMDEIARSVGLSRPHFFALFKQQMRISPNVYWNTLRMEEALRQLQSSDKALATVAANLGFTTQGNFTRFFRDHAGVPPKVYREAARLAA